MAGQVVIELLLLALASCLSSKDGPDCGLRHLAFRRGRVTAFLCMRRGCLFLCQTQMLSLTKRVPVEHLRVERTLLTNGWVEERACCSKEQSGSRSCIKIYQHQVLCSWGWALGPCKPLPSLPVELSQQLPPALLPHMPEVTMPTKCSGKLYSCLLHWFLPEGSSKPLHFDSASNFVKQHTMK